MERRLTITDVARHARVSKTTVSRVLNERPDVDAETSARVRAVVRKLGYVPNATAVQLSRGAANAIGLLGPFDMSAWFIEVIRSALERLHPSDFSLVIHSFPETEEAADRFWAQLRSGRVDALLVCSLLQPVDMVYRLHAEGLPMVAINDYGFNGDIPTIAPDDVTGITEAANHLFDVGRRRFAMLVGPDDFPVSAGRLDAYRKALADRGVALDDRLVIGSSYTDAGAYAATRELLRRGVPFDALMASSDAMAVGAMRALKHEGIRIPDDVSVVGFDDFAAATATDPPLTTVRYPLQEMSARAVDQLLIAAREKARVPPGKDIVRTHLVIRESSDPRRKGSEQGRTE
jgi:LacI family transcriptional regulator